MTNWTRKEDFDVRVREWHNQRQDWDLEEAMEEFLKFSDEKTETTEEMDLVRKYVEKFLKEVVNPPSIAKDEQKMLEVWTKSVLGDK